MFRIVAFLMLVGLFVDRYGWQPLGALVLTGLAVEVVVWSFVNGRKPK